MKKILYTLLPAVVCFALIAFGINASKVTYTKEFSYLPAYSSKIKADSVSQPNKAGFILGNYTLKNTNNTKVFQDYENILKKNGWTVTKEQKPTSFTIKKDSHQTTILLLQKSKDVKMLISSK
jgi:hypothetical protein